ARRARRTETSGVSYDPICWQHAEGSNVLDVDGNRYVDFTSGFGVAAIGHRHPEVVKAIRDQSGRLLHALGDVHPSDVKIELLEQLSRVAPFHAGRVILGQNGSDAVEAALKTALLATGKRGVLAFDGGYHGLSYGTLPACGSSPKFRLPFQNQLSDHVTIAPFPNQKADLDACLTEVREKLHSSIGLILIEPIQGRSGVRFPPPGFLQGIRKLCNEFGALLCIDEIFTGFGRTGSYWASSSEPCAPDLLCVGKALGGGLPISACIGTLDVMKSWGDPDGEALHTATFFGNPLACSTALATLRVIHGERLPERAVEIGEQLSDALAPLRHLSFVREVRSLGLMTGIEFDTTRRGLRIVRRLLERGYLVLPAGNGNVIQLCPPLTISSELIDSFAETINSIALEEEEPAAKNAALRNPSSGLPGKTSRPALRTAVLKLMADLQDGGQDEARRDELLLHLVDYQRGEIPALQKLYKAQPRAAVPTDLFRYTRLSVHGEAQDCRRFLTSGTTKEKRGLHPFREMTFYNRSAKSFAKYALFPDVEKMPLIVLIPPESELPESSLSYMVTRFAEWFGTGEPCWVFRENQLDIGRLRQRLSQASTPVALLGTSFAFVEAENSLEDARFQLPPGSRIMQTGGFKGRSRTVAPEEMRQLLSRRYGLDERLIISEYGMTELSSQFYENTLREAVLGLPETPRRLLSPGWVRFDILDASTLLPTEDEGLIRIDDAANLDSCCSVQTSDIGIRILDGFQVLGRTEGAPARGCSLTAESMFHLNGAK
ncbi:MAG: aminotransferase class III-fold pyridoxal phosphate-dependent enzyme, partial [Myxococcota bacterium]